MVRRFISYVVATIFMITTAVAAAQTTAPAQVGTVTGRVIDAEGKPAAGVHVRRAADGPPQVAVTNAQGQFIMKDIRLGYAVLYATNWDDTKLQGAGRPNSLHMGIASTSIVVRPDVEIALTDPIKLAPTAKVTGKVIGLDGAPAASVQDRSNQTAVRLNVPLAGEGTFYGIDIPTNDKGEFTIIAVPIIDRPVIIDAFTGLRARGIHGSTTVNLTIDQVDQTVNVGEIKLTPRPPEGRGRTSRSGRG
jgi:hypothetical protein